jgi:hypothetical protein
VETRERLTRSKTRQESGLLPGARHRLADAIPRQPDTATAWRTFEAALADALGLLEEDEFLIVGAKRHQHYVQFAGQGPHGMWVEAVSNVFIDDPADRLSDAQHERIAALGWDGPRETAPRPQAPPGASVQGNFFLDVAAPAPAAQLARLACTTLHDVYGIPHPGEMEYTAFHARGQGIRFPTLRLHRRVCAPPAPRDGPDQLEPP